MIFKSVFDADVEEGEIIEKDGISLSYCIVPESADSGCLESALLENYNSEKSDCVEQFVECLDNLGFVNNQNKHDKLMVRSLTIAEHPDMTFSSTANKGLWDWGSGSMLYMLEFIKRMNGSSI